MQKQSASTKSDLKSDLFVRVHDLNGIRQELDKILLMPKHQRDTWVEDNQAILHSMLESYVEDSSLVVEAIDQDPETVGLSLEYVESLRDVVFKVKTMLYDVEELEV